MQDNPLAKQARQEATQKIEASLAEMQQEFNDLLLRANEAVDFLLVSAERITTQGQSMKKKLNRMRELNNRIKERKSQ